MRILVTRPREDAAALASRLERLGHSVLSEPLLTIELLPGAIGPLEGVTAIVATSRNGLRALAASPRLAPARALPLFTVGRSTSALGRELGFGDLRGGDGTAIELAERIAVELDPAAGPILHLAGDHVTAGLGKRLTARGFRLIRPVCYQSRAQSSLSPACAAELAAGSIGAVILLSPRTAAIYARLTAADGRLDAAHGPVHVCISGAAAEALVALGPIQVAIARRPNLDEIVALVRGLAADA